MIYELTKRFPKEEQYGLTQQIRRSAVSVSSNIAGGAGRKTARDFSHFLNTAYGSLCELETQILIAKRLNYFGEGELKTVDREIDELQKMVFSFVRKLESRGG